MAISSTKRQAYLPLFDQKPETNRPLPGLPEFDTTVRSREKLVTLFTMIRDEKNVGVILGSLHSLGIVHVGMERALHTRVRSSRGSRLSPEHETDFVAWARAMGPYYTEIITLFGKQEVQDYKAAALRHFEEHGSRMHYWTTTEHGNTEAKEMELQHLGLAE